MHSRQARSLTAHGVMLAALLTLAGCTHLHWPWHRSAPPPPTPVHALDVSGTAAPPQYWVRNTLLIDLSAAGGEGHLVLKPTDGTWPVRLAFRVVPGAFGALEVRGAAREVLPITATGAKPVDLELPPGIYVAGTAQLSVSWGPQSEPATP